MVFERKVTSKGNEYWVLIHPIRKGKKIMQKSKYIGKTLPQRERLEQLKKEFLLELTESKFKYLSAEDVKNIGSKKQDYKEELEKLSLSEKKKRLEEFVIRYTYDSSKLAGVKVNLRQTYLILKEGIIPKGFKNLRTVKELENHEKAVIAITKYKGALNIKFIKKIHRILLSGVDDSIAGELRSDLKRDVAIAGTPYVPPKWHEINKEFKKFFKWYKEESRKLHPLELTSLIHLRLISIQPFVDGNSRLSRLLMNWILWKKNYPPINIPVEDLEDYYNVVDKYQIERKEKPFIDYIKRLYLK